MLVCKYCNKNSKNKNAHLQHEVRCKSNSNVLKLECKFCNRICISNSGLGRHQNLCSLNPNRKIISSWNKGLTALTNESVRKSVIALKNVTRIGRKHSEETKEKISKARKSFLLENPEMVPYKLNHYSKGPSYPELYFIEAFKDLNLEREYKVSLYSLDFADVNKKIDIEIDGEQHFSDKMIDHDNKRNKYLENLGWKIIRIRWSSFKKLSRNEKEIYIQNIKSLVN